MKKLTRREREKLVHQREILDAAERVFVRNEFDQTTIEQIAKEADFSIGAIYNFFDGKKNLCSKVITKIIEEFLTVFRDEVLFEQNPIVAIEVLIDRRYDRVHFPYAYNNTNNLQHSGRHCSWNNKASRKNPARTWGINEAV